MGPEPIKSMFDSINMHEKHERNTKMIEIIAKNRVLYQKIEDELGIKNFLANRPFLIRKKYFRGLKHRYLTS